jgi:drug/metabolite transporter (DMT)-like permease
MRSRWVSGLWLAGLSAVAFSGKAVIVKLAYRENMDAITLITCRMAMALPFFIGLAWWFSRGQVRLSRQDLGGVIGLGFCGYYLASFLDFWGLAYISLGLERLILYLSPLFVLLLRYFVWKKPIHRMQWLGMGLSYLGVLWVFGWELGLFQDGTLFGTSLIFCSAISYAIYLSLSESFVRRLGPLRLAGWATSFACLFCLGHFGLTHVHSHLLGLDALRRLPASVWVLSGINALACTVLPMILMMMAIERIGSGLAAQVGMIGPLSTMLMGWLILNEAITWPAWLGTILVLLGVFLSTFSRDPKQG